MKVSYNPRADAPSMLLKEGASVAEDDEGASAVILDYDEGGDLVSPKIMTASGKVTGARKIEFEVAE
jgi:uncharacterized protein YuzE